MKSVSKLISFLIGIVLLFIYISCNNNFREPTYYNIIFNSNGGSIVSNQTIESGKTAKRPLNPTKDSTDSIIYTFDDWYSDNLLTTVFDFSTPITSNKTLYAKWIETKITYTVTFNSDGGSNIPEQIIEKGKLATKPFDPTKEQTTTERFTFSGWYSDKTLTDLFDFSTPITKDITLYAKWITQKRTYTVSFNSNGGTEIKSQTVISKNTISEPTMPTRNATSKIAYVFAGWYIDSTLNIKFDFSTKIISDMTLYAKWTEKEINVPENFVYVVGGTINKKVNGSAVFIDGRIVKIKDMYVCNHEVTQKEYESFCCYGGKAPSDACGVGDNYPVYNVSWYDAIVYCNLRSLSEGLCPVYSLDNETDPRKWKGIVSKSIDDTIKYCGPSSNNSAWNNLSLSIIANGYRLPTEIEWEYIARCGNNGIFPIQTSYSGSNLIEDVAWYNTNSTSMTHEVNRKISNTLGVYDMSGNVFEMCYDLWGPITNSTGEFGSTLVGAGTIYRVKRGGSWYNNANACDISYRIGGTPEFRGDITGFRVVRSEEINKYE